MCVFPPLSPRARLCQSCEQSEGSCHFSLHRSSLNLSFPPDRCVQTVLTDRQKIWHGKLNYQCSNKKKRSTCLALVATQRRHALLSVTDLIRFFAHEMSSVCWGSECFSDVLCVFCLSCCLLTLCFSHINGLSLFFLSANLIHPLSKALNLKCKITALAYSVFHLSYSLQDFLTLIYLC